MPKRASLEFIESNEPITDPVTKFGGQPVWVGEPQWPLSKSTGNLMRFICQIAIDPGWFKTASAQMAYFFITDEEEYVDETWEPDGGENAVILQPGQTTLPTKAESQGPTLYRLVKKPANRRLVSEPCEYSVALKIGEEPDFIDERERTKWELTKREEYLSALHGNKIGGSPFFIQNTEYPGPGRWHLLLQLHSTTVPFSVNFGDSGAGYLFLSEDGRTAKFLWQCF
jgi:uncharacterized protein YwqG